MKGKVLIAVLILAAFGLGWLCGIEDGYNTGYRSAYLELNNLLNDGLESGQSFYISGLPLRFYPSGSSVRYIKVAR